MKPLNLAIKLIRKNFSYIPSHPQIYIFLLLKKTEKGLEFSDLVSKLIRKTFEHFNYSPPRKKWKALRIIWFGEKVCQKSFQNLAFLASCVQLPGIRLALFFFMFILVQNANWKPAFLVAFIVISLHWKSASWVTWNYLNLECKETSVVCLFSFWLYTTIVHCDTRMCLIQIHPATFNIDSYTHKVAEVYTE